MSQAEILLLTTAARSFAEAEGLRTGATAVIISARETLSASAAFVAINSKDDSVVNVIASAGIGAADFRRLEARLARAAIWRSQSVPQPVAIDDIRQDPHLDFLAFSLRLRCLIAVPIILKHQFIGLFAIAFDQPASDEESLIGTLQALAALTAHAVQVERAVDQQMIRVAEENANLRLELKERYDLGNLVGNSGPMRLVFDQAAQVARTASPVLLRGEDGTGKELIANSIHYNSLRSKRAYLAVSCSSLPDEQAEIELFGSESSGAIRKGLLEQADGGTLFIDDIEDLSQQAQLKLLRVIQEGEFERTGGSESVVVNTRIVAASRSDLNDAATDGEFRPDLLARLGTTAIFLPPLRDRKADILLLAEHFLKRFQKRFGTEVRRISTPAIDMLTAYHFPGNVRELENVIEYAVQTCDSAVIHGYHLPPTLQTAEVSDTVTRVTLASAVEAFEKDLIVDTLKSTRGNIAKAALMLDSTERILGYKIKKYSIESKRFRR